MDYKFLDTKGATKCLANLIEGIIWLCVLFFVGMHKYAPISSVILGIYMGITVLMYVISLLILMFCNKKTFTEICAKTNKTSTGELMSSGIIFGCFVMWIIFTINGTLVYGNKNLILIITGKLILPMLVLIIREIKARSFGYVSSDEAILINNNYYGDWKTHQEYNYCRDSLLLVTSPKENPKAFRKLASQYYSKLNGYIE